MQNKFYAVHDEQKTEWDTDEIMLQQNDAMARRAFIDILKQKTYVASHAEDYNLYFMAEMSKNGINGFEPILIASGKELKKMIDEIQEKENKEYTKN